MASAVATLLLLMFLLACGCATAQVFPPWNGTFPMGPGGGGNGGAAAIVPAMFVFGDSLTDNGNNNDLTSLAKANYLPYGIDFAGGPTGRFSNGYTMVDEIAELLGLPLLPSHSEAASSGDAALRGVNYASAAAGILDNTGQNFVGRIPFNEQIKNFQSTLDQITGKLGAGKLAGTLARSIFYVGMGSNDYLNNYLMPNYNTRNEYNGEQYSTLLVQQYTKQLKGGRGALFLGCVVQDLVARSRDVYSAGEGVHRMASHLLLLLALVYPPSYAYVVDSCLTLAVCTPWRYTWGSSRWGSWSVPSSWTSGPFLSLRKR